jgi:Flp pilus assembly protein CpaB
MFVASDQVSLSLRRRLTEPNYVTVSVQVDQVAGVAGFLQPGDEVNIMTAIEIEQEDIESAPDQPAPGEFAIVLDTRFEMLYQNVHILAIGQETQAAPGEAAAADPDAPEEEPQGDTGLITFNVPPAAAQLIASFAADGTLYLSLIPTDYEPEPLPAPDLFITELPGQDPEQLTPYGPDGDGEAEQ